MVARYACSGAHHGMYGAYGATRIQLEVGRIEKPQIAGEVVLAGRAIGQPAELLLSLDEFIAFTADVNVREGGNFRHDIERIPYAVTGGDGVVEVRGEIEQPHAWRGEREAGNLGSDPGRIRGG